MQRLKMLKASYDSEHYAMQDKFMIKCPKLIAHAEERLKCVREDVKQRDEELVKGQPEDFVIRIGGTG